MLLLPQARKINFWYTLIADEREIFYHIFIEKVFIDDQHIHSQHGTDGIMPTKQELEEAGEGSLANAMNLHGGFPEVAQRLGLELSYSRKERDYWKNIDNLKRELLQVVEQLGIPGVMPTHEQLTEIGRTDLIAAITSNGGWPSVARRVGLTYVKHYNNPNDYF
jgi:hypothetical protein